MAESNATQVILTDDGIKIIKAQNTADNAAGGVANLNDPNLMSVIEKQYNITQFAGLTSQYNVLVQNAKDDGIDTAAVTAAYNNLNQFMASVLVDPDHASDVDRAAYKKYQDAYNEELANIQNALQNNANNKFTSAASATSQAASTANAAKSAADSAYDYANSEMAVQSNATAKAQSTADSAFSQAKTAIDTGQAASQAVTDLKDGSTLTIAELGSGLAEKVSSSEYASYKYQSASQIAEMVTDGAFSAYSQATARLISDKVATSDFSSYKEETAKDISSKVESKDFKDYQQQTADAFKRTVSTTDFDNLKIGSRNLYLNSRAIADGYGVNVGTTVTVEPFDSDTNMWHIVAPRGAGSYVGIYLYNYANGKFPDSSYWSYSADVKGTGKIQIFGIEAGSRNPVVGAVGSEWSRVSQTGRFDNTEVKTLVMYFDTTSGPVDVYIKLPKLESGNMTTDWTPAPEDLATQSQFTQLHNDIDLGVKKDGLISEINIQAKNTLISSGGQLTLSGRNIYFDTNNPVIIPSANIDSLLVDKKLTAADISANTFTTNNGTFTVEKDGAITAKNMTLTGGTLTTPTINGSTINGGTLNMQTDGLINSPYNGIQQTADQFYHPWKLNTGQLTIGQGYITSVSSGTRSINGVPKQFDSLQGTLSASYLKFTNNYGARTYIDADMFTYSNQTNDTAMVKIDADGIGIDVGTPHAPALTISNGYIDASSSSSYGIFGAITLGYDAHIINSDSSLFFESGHGSGNPGINIWAKGFQSISSRLSTKRQVRLLDDEHSNSLLLGADTATFQYNQDTNADNSNEGVIIDDVNTTKQYGLPDELITRDGKAPTDLMSFIARVISQNKYQARLIEDLQIRLRKVEIKNEQ